MDRRRVTVLIPVDEFRRLKEIAETEDRTPGEQARRLLREAIAGRNEVTRITLEAANDGQH